MTIERMEDNKQIAISELLYIAFFSVMLMAKAIGLYEGQFWYNVFLVIGMVFFAAKMLVTRHSMLEYVAFILLMALGLAVYISSGEKSLIILIAVMIGMKGVSETRVFRAGAYIWVAAFVTMYVLSVVGIIPELAYTLDRSGWPPILRHTLGYPHPNTLHVTYFILCIFVLYSCKNQSKKRNLAIAIILMIGNCCIFMFSLSRNGFLVASLYLLLHVYFTYRDPIGKIDRILVRLVFPLCALSMVVFPLVIGGELFQKLNVHFAGRFEFTRHYLTYEPMRLFGIREIPVPQENYIIDSSYVYLLFKLGIIAYVLYFVSMIFMMNRLIADEKRIELAVVLALTVGGVNETYLFNQSFKNLIFIFLGQYFFLCVSQLYKRLPGIVTEERFGFAIGDRRVKLPLLGGEYKHKTPVNIWFFICTVSVLLGIITSLAYIAIIPFPREIYLPAYEMTSVNGEEVYLSQGDVKAIKREGGIVRGYVDESIPLYRINRRGTAIAEYVRYCFSYGLWTCSLIAVVSWLIWTARSKIRYLLKNRTISSEYKENVLIVHNYYRIPGGEDIVVSNEKALLEKNGHKVTLYTRNNEEAGDSSFFRKIGLAFTSVFNVRTYKEICALIEKKRIDVIHVHNTVALISPAVYIAGINMGIPVVQTVHNFRLVCPNGECYIKGHVCERCIEHGLKASLLYNCYRNSKMQTFVCALTMKIQRALLTYKELNYICLTEFNKQKLLTIKQINKERVYIKPNFTTIETEVVPYEYRKKQIIYAGRLEKIKGVDLMFQAWMKLGDKAPKLVVCGSGELEEWCREYIENNEITNIEMRGQIPNAEVKKLVGESLAMLYPTQWYEGFPMAVAEAYTVGTPIIASDIGNVNDLVDEGISGVKFKSNSVVGLARAVETFMEAPIELPGEYILKYTADSNYIILKKIYESVRKQML